MREKRAKAETAPNSLFRLQSLAGRNGLIQACTQLNLSQVIWNATLKMYISNKSCVPGVIEPASERPKEQGSCAMPGQVLFPICLPYEWMTPCVSNNDHPRLTSLLLSSYGHIGLKEEGEMECERYKRETFLKSSSF